MNREVKVIIPNMREFGTFYSDNEGVIGMFFKRDWEEVKHDEHWKPSEEHMKSLKQARDYYMSGRIKYVGQHLNEIAEQLEKQM